MTTILPNDQASTDASSASRAVTDDPSVGPPQSGRRKKRMWRSVLRQPLAAISLGYLVLLVVAAAAAPIIAPYDPNALDLGSVLSGPTVEHLLGTDPLGRDVLSRLIYGGRVSLVNASIAVLTFLVVGVCSGLVAGFRGGWTDRAFTWVVDVLLAVPGLIVLLVVLAVFDSNMAFAMIALGILAAPGFARVVRGVTLAVRQELYIAAARVSGLPNRHIILKHVLPRVTGPILVQVSLFCGSALLVDAGLSYLGFGVQPPTATWGGMIIEASTVISDQPWLLAPPGVVLGLATLAFALLGDAIRDSSAERTGRAPTREKRRQERTATASPSVATIKSLPPSKTALLSLRGVSIALPIDGHTTTVVEDLNLDIEAGETIGLVGESGCGKSITASAILGLLPANGWVSSGTVTFDGADLATADRAAIRRLRGSQIAMISQEPVASLDPAWTAGQQVAELVRRHHGGSRKAVRARTLELLASVSLRDPERVARRYPHELSGGMAQRVAIAMALAGEPKLLVADEPTTALDVTVQAEILHLLKQLQSERDMAILLITHDWGVVAQTCRRAYVMYAGHVVESARIDDMLTQPRHPYTTGLLNSAPHRSRPGVRLVAIPGSVPPPGQWPEGCHFAPRCALATDECRAMPIPMFEPVSGHQSRCIHHELTAGGRNA